MRRGPLVARDGGTGSQRWGHFSQAQTKATRTSCSWPGGGEGAVVREIAGTYLPITIFLTGCSLLVNRSVCFSHIGASQLALTSHAPAPGALAPKSMWPMIISVCVCVCVWMVFLITQSTFCTIFLFIFVPYGENLNTYFFKEMAIEIFLKLDDLRWWELWTFLLGRGISFSCFLLFFGISRELKKYPNGKKFLRRYGNKRN